MNKVYKMLLVAFNEEEIKCIKSSTQGDDQFYIANNSKEVSNIISNVDISFAFVNINGNREDVIQSLDYLSDPNNYFNEIYTVTEPNDESFELLSNYRPFDIILKPLNKYVLANKIRSMKGIISSFEGIESRLSKMNKEHLEALAQLNPNIVGTFRVDVTSGVCNYCNTKHLNTITNVDADDLLKKISMYIVDESAREKYVNDFSMKTLTHHYKNNEFTFSRNDVFEFEKGIYSNVTTKVNLYTNPVTMHIEALSTSYDVTNAYETQIIQKKLVYKNYDSIALIRLSDKKIKIFNQLLEAKEINIPYEYFDYQTQRMLVAENYIPIQYRNTYLKKSDLDYVVSMLNDFDTYSFTIKTTTKDNKISEKQFSFFYFDEKKNEIITTLQEGNLLLEVDELSNSLNNRGFIRNVVNVLSDSSIQMNYSILFFDIIGFKAINTLFGTSFADQIITEFPYALKKFGFDYELLGRIEADHFVCLMESQLINEDKLTELLHSQFTFENKTITLSARCGIYEIPKGETDVNKMIASAKLAAEYHSQDILKSYHYYNSQMNEIYIDSAISHFDLERAIYNKEFMVYYQPVYDVKTRKVASAEALIRWKHPDYGMMSPARFIPSLEKSGEISKVDAYVLHETILMNQERISNGKEIIPISTNLSRMDLFDNDMLNGLLHDINKSKMTEYIRLEITESVYSAIASQGVGILNKLKKQGTKFYIDDFGSGYSSFATITEYDFDYLKLDISLTRQIGLNAKIENIIGAVIKMSHDLGLKIVAEGVETEEQFNFLSAVDCDYIQGYYFSKPLDRIAFEKLIDDK